MAGMQLISFSLQKSLALLSIPLLGYLLAFVYQWKFLSHFGLPISVISVGRDDVLVAVVTLVAAILSLLGVFQLLVMAFSEVMEGHGALQASVRRTVIFIILITPILTVFSTDPTSLKVKKFLLALAFILFLEFGFPFLFHSKWSSVIQRMEHANEADKKLKGIENFIAEWTSGSFLIFLLTVGMIIFYASLAGQTVAQSQKTYLVFERDGTQYVLLQKNVAIAIDSLTKKVKDDILLLPQDAGLVASLQEVGPLTQ